MWSKCYLGQITLFIRCQYSIGLELCLGLGLMYKWNLVIPWFLKICCRRVDQSASYPVRDLTDRELVCRRVVLLSPPVVGFDSNTNFRLARQRSHHFACFTKRPLDNWQSFILPFALEYTNRPISRGFSAHKKSAKGRLSLSIRPIFQKHLFLQKSLFVLQIFKKCIHFTSTKSWVQLT